ncbi:heme-binding protein 2-like [Mustelus asterias]
MLPVLLMTLHLLSQGVLAQRDLKPYFCSEVKECYSFVRVCKDSEYETRAYEPSVWVGSRVQPSEEKYRAVDRLKDYFNKKNVPGIQIERTMPLLTRYYLDINGRLTPNFVYYVLPRRHFVNPPRPRDISVILGRVSPLTIHVKTFGGWITSLRQKPQEMFEDLLRQKENFIRDYFFTAEYNGPLTILGRHNEIWYLDSGFVPRCLGRRRYLQ